MNLFSKCNIPFSEEPYQSISSEGNYCSEECSPEDSLEHPYFFEYMNLMSSFHHFQEKKLTIQSFEERIDLENEIDLVIEDYKSLYFGDSEGSFYKAHILQLYEKLLLLNDEVNDVLHHREYETYYGVSIYWHEIWNTVGDDLLSKIYLDLLDHLSETYFFYRNLSWEAKSENEISPRNFKDVLCFLTIEDQQRFVSILKQIFEKYQSEHVATKVFHEDEFTFIYTPSIRKCFVCGHWEAEADFKFDSERNVHVCNQWEACEV
ncbi:hypothetical protein [Paenibacillus vini]|uniref:Uncharacterized protein n=1 Tax=Paenibacillus vini TaxID=1476024 RepID=A0ABQ4MAI3_9BACL|nr:hypothetical protein [Paenibacillus vini]GIP52928.1 hypothetical protein J42TS3_19630 [Paenibacillus vini]